MSTSVSSTVPPPISPVTPWVSWAAVLAGCVTAIAFEIGLTELCLGLGLAFYEPGDASSSGSSVAAGTAIAMLVCALLSIFAGGWVAGRMKRHGTRAEAAIHGMLVWAAASILALVLATLSLGMLTSGAFKLLGEAVTGTAKGISAGVSAAMPAMKDVAMPTWDSIKEQITDAGASPTAQASGAPPNDNRFADQSRLMQLLGQVFTADAAPLAESDRQEVQQLLASQLGISADAARATLEQWQRVWKESVERYNTVKEDTKQTIIDTATAAKKHTSQVAIISFFIMLAGLGAGLAGALCGCQCLWTRAKGEIPHPTNSPTTYL